jgi:capsular polysaccharide biosynthesis protein
MDIWQSLVLLGRRWVFLSVALLLAVVVTAGVFHEVKPQYQATSALLLVPPTAPSTKTAGNFVNDYGSLDTVASIVSDWESSQEFAAQLKATGIDNYTVSTDPTGSVPELLVTATASSPAEALAQNRTLSQDAVNYLFQMQLGASPNSLISTRVLAVARATRDDKSRIRVVVAVGVVLVFLAVALTFLYDSMMRRRKQSRKREREASTRRPDEAGFESEAPLMAGGRLSNRAAVQYGRHADGDPSLRSIGAPGASSTPASFYPKN